MQELIKKLKKAKESKNSNWIDEVCRKIEKMEKFFEIAEKVNLVVNGYYVDGLPKGLESNINEFYKLEDYLDYPKPQKI